MISEMELFSLQSSISEKWRKKVFNFPFSTMVFLTRQRYFSNDCSHHHRSKVIFIYASIR
jgi:hypothetical protein